MRVTPLTCSHNAQALAPVLLPAILKVAESVSRADFVSHVEPALHPYLQPGVGVVIATELVGAMRTFISQVRCCTPRA